MELAQHHANVSSVWRATWEYFCVILQKPIW